ncbi:MAG: hypothetical protein IJT43_00645 [Stomatobaculum sp.]|nr:hypothetical protein [Stomatobaculum sp.]
MPRLKERPIPFLKMQRLIRSYGYNGSNLEPVLGYSPKTIRKKIEDPRQLTLGDLEKICKSGHIPMEEIREAIVL